MKLFYSLIFCVGTLWCTAQEVDPTQKVWTLQECLEYAMENNIQVRQSALRVETNKNNLESAKWDYAPSVNGSANYSWNFGLNIDPVTNEISQTTRQTSFLSLNGNWLLFDGTRKWNTITQNNLDYMAALMDLETAKNDIGLNVAGGYLQVLLNQEILGVAREQERVTQLQVDRTQRLVDAGAAPMGDLLQLQAQLARDVQNRTTAENSLNISKMQLANLLQLDNPDDFEIADPEFTVPEAALVMRDPSAIYATALENQPNIEAAELRVRSSEEGVEISKSGWYPSLSLQGRVASNYSDQFQEPTTANEIQVPIPTYDDQGNVFYTPSTRTIPQGFQFKSFGNQLEDNINEFVGVNLQIPIFNRMTVRNQVQNAMINQEITALSLEQEKNALRQNIYQAHADAKASYNSYLAAQKAVEANEESFAYAQKRFEVGALNQFDFENAKNNLAISRSEMLRAKYDFIFKINVLEFYLTNQVNF